MMNTCRKIAFEMLMDDIKEINIANTNACYEQKNLLIKDSNVQSTIIRNGTQYYQSVGKTDGTKRASNSALL
jgi:hypothetical protein